jgi:hypothetical protein
MASATTSSWLQRQLKVAFGFLALLASSHSFAEDSIAEDGVAQNAVMQVQPSAALEKPAVQFYVDDIKTTMQTYIASQLDSEGNFYLLDEKTDELLALKFIRVHDPVRQIEGNIYFACTDFHVVGKPDKIYDLDFWMNGKTGELIVYDNKVHKEPRWSLFYGWYKHPRYTFVNDKIEYLY